MTPRTAEGDNIPLAIGLTLLSVLIFGVQDAIAKVLVQTWSPFQISMMRYWAFGLFSLFLVTRRTPLRKAFATRMPKWQVARGVLLIIDVWLFGLAIRTVPLPELQSIGMLYPLVVTVFAVPLLGERVGWFRISAIALGFAGALIIIRPGGLPLDWGAGFALLAATSYALYIICTRKVAAVDSTATSMLYVGVIGMVLSTAVGVFFWEPIGFEGLVMVAFLMVTTISAHSIMMVALRHAPASAVQPFNYAGLPWAIVLSFVVFGHLIDPISLVGATIIVGAGLIVWLRERRSHVNTK